jgi:transketolase
MLSNLQKRIVQVTYEEKLSHLSSTLSAAPILQEIFTKKAVDEVFILSNGHAGLALYCILEFYYSNVNAVELLHKHGIHPGKDLENHLYCSTGSLGSGLPIAVGHALATPEKKVYCMISDGEAAEGSIWEALRFVHDYKVDNLEIYVNINGLGAYDSVDTENLVRRLQSFLPRINIRISEPYKWSFAKDLLTHYYVMNEKDYQEVLK